MRPVVRSVVAFAAVFACLSPISASAFSEPITKLESRRLSPNALKKRVLDQLSDILVSEPWPSDRRAHPHRRLSDLGFWTRPHATAVRGLCEANTIIVDFDPVGPPNGADTEVTARHLDVSTQYRFVAPPQAPDADYIGEEAHGIQDAACLRLDVRKDRFFSAASVEAATAGMWSLNAALKAAADRPAGFSLTCEGPNSVSGEACRRRLQDVASSLLSVSSCDASHHIGEECWAVDGGEFELRIIVARGERPAVRKVVVVAQFVVADERAD